MAPTMLRLALALALALTGPALSNPFKRQSCEVQSCVIASLSGSSDVPYDPSTPPTGGTDAGDCCVLTYNPSARAVLYAEKPELAALCPTLNRVRRRDTMTSTQIENIKRATCAPYTLIFARGTGEIGTLGETVGPALEAGLDAAAPGSWSIQGVNYDASVDGDDCLGLPGGRIAAQLLESVASSCPSTKIIMSGYSEGAMVAHNGVAYASASAAARVTGVVVFGDPFNGAPIRQYRGPIQTYCAVGDDVCEGEFVITAAHLSYVGVDTSEAVAYISNLVK